jgi:hypothetical protein
MGISRTWIYDEQSRGRSSGRFRMLRSIVLIGAKYDLDPKLLIDAFIKSWNTNLFCEGGSLRISCRGVSEGSVTFLITSGGKVVSQFPIKLELLGDPDSFKSFIQSISIPDHFKTKTDQKQKKIAELRLGMKGVSVRGKVVEVTPRRSAVSRFGYQFYTSVVRVADETGAISLNLWNSQIDRVHLGDEVEIQNCHVYSFRGATQLRVGKKGAISTIRRLSVES